MLTGVCEISVTVMGVLTRVSCVFCPVAMERLGCISLMTGRVNTQCNDNGSITIKRNHGPELVALHRCNCVIYKLFEQMFGSLGFPSALPSSMECPERGQSEGTEPSKQHRAWFQGGVLEKATVAGIHWAAAIPVLYLPRDSLSTLLILGSSSM